MIVYTDHIDRLDVALRKEEPVVVMPPLHPDYLRRLVLAWMGGPESGSAGVRLFEPGLGVSKLDPWPGSPSAGVLKGHGGSPSACEFLRTLIDAAGGPSKTGTGPSSRKTPAVSPVVVHWLVGSDGIMGDPVALSLLTALCRRIVAYRLPWRLLMNTLDGPVPAALAPWKRDLELQAPRNEDNAEDNFAERVLRRLSPDLCAMLAEPREGRERNDLDDIVRKVQGLDAAAINIVLAAAVHQSPVDAPDDERLEKLQEVIEQERGRQLMRASGLEVVLIPSEREELQGMNRFQRYLDYVSVLFDDAGRPGADASGPRPRGVLLAGLPGCGKSLAARLTAERLRVPLLRMDVGGMLGRYLGESEANLRRALDAAEAAAPCVLWVDEIEKALGQSDEGGGTSKRMLGQLLTWMQDHKSQVYIFATANSVKKLPPELLRRGRFDELWRVMLPTPTERKSILGSKLKALKTDVDEEFEADERALKEVVRETNDFTGADLTSLVQEAWMAARVFEQKVKKQHLLDVLGRGFVPMSVQFKDEIKESIADLDKHGFRDVTCDPKELPAEVPAERKKARGRLVPALSELWNGMEAGRVVIRRGKKAETLKVDERKGDERPVWLVAGDIVTWPCKGAIRGTMVRQGGRLTVSFASKGKSADEQQHHFEWDVEAQRVSFRGEPVELSTHAREARVGAQAATASGPEARNTGGTKARNPTKKSLEALTVPELKDLARDHGIPKASNMPRRRLIEAIHVARRASRRRSHAAKSKAGLTLAGQTLEFALYGKKHQIELPNSDGEPATLKFGTGLKYSHPYTGNRLPDGGWKLKRGEGRGPGGFELAQTIDIEVNSAGVEIRVAGSRAYHVRQVESTG